MTKGRHFIERRKHERFKVKKDIVAVSISDEKKLGKIKDISKGGLTLVFKESDEQAKELMKVDILSIADDFYLRNLPVKTVLGAQAAANRSWDDWPQWRLGLQFEKLTYYQKLLLNFFLQKYTQK